LDQTIAMKIYCPVSNFDCTSNLIQLQNIIMIHVCTLYNNMLLLMNMNLVYRFLSHATNVKIKTIKQKVGFSPFFLLHMIYTMMLCLT